MTIATDFVAVLEDRLVEKAKLRKATITTDTLGNVSNIVNPDITIECSIQPINEKNWNIIEFGLPVTGEMIGYFKPSYTQFSTDYEVEENDEIYWNDANFRVEEIMSKPEHGGSAVYIKARLVRI